MSTWVGTPALIGLRVRRLRGGMQCNGHEACLLLLCIGRWSHRTSGIGQHAQQMTHKHESGAKGTGVRAVSHVLLREARCWDQRCKATQRKRMYGASKRNVSVDLAPLCKLAMKVGMKSPKRHASSGASSQRPYRRQRRRPCLRQALPPHLSGTAACARFGAPAHPRCNACGPNC